MMIYQDLPHAQRENILSIMLKFQVKETEQKSPLNLQTDDIIDNIEPYIFSFS